MTATPKPASVSFVTDVINYGHACHEGDPIRIDAARKIVVEQYAILKSAFDESERKRGEAEAKVELLEGELKASEDGSGITNVAEQFDAQLKAERDAHDRTESARREAEDKAAQWRTSWDKACAHARQVQRELDAASGSCKGLESRLRATEFERDSLQRTLDAVRNAPRIGYRRDDGAPGYYVLDVAIERALTPPAPSDEAGKVDGGTFIGGVLNEPKPYKLTEDDIKKCRAVMVDNHGGFTAPITDNAGGIRAESAPYADVPAANRGKTVGATAPAASTKATCVAMAEIGDDGIARHSRIRTEPPPAPPTDAGAMDSKSLDSVLTLVEHAEAFAKRAREILNTRRK